MKINQVIAIEKTTKNRVEDAFTALFQQAQKAELFEGLSRTYRSAKDGGEQLPPESKKVQLNAKELVVTTMKTLGDIRSFALALPTLDPAEDWKFDPATSVSRTETKSTHRTKKEPKVIVKYPATPEHPAQTDLVTEDNIVGFWDMQKISGALMVSEKKGLVERVEKLQAAVKVAREEANSVAAKKVSVSDALNAYLIG